jgi:hypothetical protein
MLRKSFYLGAQVQSSAFCVSREVGVKEVIFFRYVEGILNYGAKS